MKTQNNNTIDMQNESISKMIKVCEQVATDMKNDAIEFDGKPFTGKVVATYFGYHGAAIAALADTLKELLNTIQKEL